MKAEERIGGANPSGPRPAPFRMEKALAGLEEAPGSAEARRRLEELRARGDQFLARYPTWESLDHAAARRRASAAAKPGPSASARKIVPFRPRTWLALAAGLLLCLVSARLVLGPRGDRGLDLASKGGPYFAMLVSGRPAPADRDIPAAPGDTVQIFLHNHGPLHYAVFYRDDGGPWELYFASERQAPASTRGEPLQHSIVLDAGWRNQDIAALAGTEPPGAAGRDCLPDSPTGEHFPGRAPADAPVKTPERALKTQAPAHCRDLTLNLFRLRSSIR